MNLVMSDSNPSQSNGDFGWTADFDSVDIPGPVTFGAFDDVTANIVSKPSEVKVRGSSWQSCSDKESTSQIQVNGSSLPDDSDTSLPDTSLPDTFLPDTSLPDDSDAIVKTEVAIDGPEIEKRKECPPSEQESGHKESFWKASSPEESSLKPNKIQSNVLSIKEINRMFNGAFSGGKNSSFSSCDPCPGTDVSRSNVSKSNVSSRTSVNESSLEPSSEDSDDEWKSLVNVLSNALSNDLVWKNLEAMEGAQSVVKIKWNSTSHSFHTFLRSLNIDPNQIVRDDVPIFASGLGSVLEPVKKSTCDNSMASSLQPILTPQPFSSTVQVTSSINDPIKPRPVDGPVTWNTVDGPVTWNTVDGSVIWNNGVQSVDSNRPQAEVSRSPKPVPFSCPTDVPFHPVSNVHNSSFDTIVVTVNPVRVKLGSNGNSSITNSEKEWIGQSIKSEQQQCYSKEIGGGFDRVLTSDSNVLKDRCPSTKNDQCPPTVHQPLHTNDCSSSSSSNDSSSSSVLTPNNDSLPILAFLSTHLQP